MAVGLVSGTVLRHLVQIIPIGLAAGVLSRRPAWGANAALPIFLIWTVIRALIWLFLLGLSRIGSGHYAATEVVATLVMAGCSVVGAIKSIAAGRPLSIGGRAFLVILFAAAQISAMWVSFLPSIARR